MGAITGLMGGIGLVLVWLALTTEPPQGQFRSDHKRGV